MPRLQPIDPDNAPETARRLLQSVQSDWGMTPNIVRTLANAPLVLEGYLSFSNALSSGLLPAELREQIAVTVAEANHCNYCLAAHCAIGRTVGLSEDAISDARRGASPNAKVNAVIRFAREMVEKRGGVDDDEVSRLRAAGYGDEEIIEIIANVAISIFTNYLNHVAETEVDFPEVP
jgi:uncharacterized peroxidase-related enzyme